MTGAARGLGRAYAMHAATCGAQVVVNDIDCDGARRVTDEIVSAGGDAVEHGGSIADWSEAGDLVATCVRSFGRVDGLVNNAGVMSARSPLEEDEASIRLVVDVNLVGAMYVGVHAAKAMVDGARGGSIVNITSSAQMGIKTLGAYGATKGALASLTYAWALDLASAGIRVNAYSPVALTPMVAAGPDLLADLPSPEDNAAVVSYLLSDLSMGITGQVVKREAAELIVMSPPRPTEARAAAASWDIDMVVERFDPVLRQSAQPVGAPNRGGPDGSDRRPAR